MCKAWILGENITMEPDNTYLAIIGDLVKSKSITDREAIQDKLESTLHNINERYSQVVISKFLITLGDEFQGLLRPTNLLFDIITDIVEAIEPVQIRFGVGYGSISTKINDVALGMDGPAFYEAREAMDKAHKYKGHVIIFHSPPADNSRLAVNTSLLLLSQVRNLWSDKNKLIHACIRANMNQVQIASQLGISQSAVSQMMYKSRIAEIREAEGNVKQLLNTLFGYHSSANNC